MNKTELIDEIALNTGLPKKAIGDVLASLGHVARAEMNLDGGELTLPGIGKLKAIVKPSRTARNPVTGETFITQPKNGVKLVVAKEMKDVINA